MSAPVTAAEDLKSAATLAATFAALAAAAVPTLLDALPPEARTIPLPLPVFCAILAGQAFVVYGLLALAGLRLARARGREPAPALTALWAGRPVLPWLRPLAVAFGCGLACGAFLIAAVLAIQRLAPETLPKLLHPPSLGAALLASAAASVGEEILSRLFLLSALLRLLPATRAGVAAAVGLSALAFGVLHAPAAVFLFGGFEHVPPVSWAWVLGLNGLLGVAFAALFLRWGFGAAAAGHFGTDLVWHVLSQLL